MSLRVAVQMDPLETIKIAGDSSFALMEAAQSRGHSLFHYDVGTLAWQSDGSPSGRITMRRRFAYSASRAIIFLPRIAAGSI